MKKLISLILFVSLALSGFSQNFKPLIHQNNGDTFLCFNLAQSRVIAKELLRGRYCDSISKVSEFKIGQLYGLAQLKDSVIHYRDQQISVLGCALGKSDEIIGQHEQNVKNLSQRLRSNRRQRTVLLVCSVLLGAAWLLK